MIRYRINIILTAFIIVLCFVLAMPATNAEDAAAPAADETLIYVLLRANRLAGGGVKRWIAVNDETVARVKNGQYAVVRAKSGPITLSLASNGVVWTAKAVDDRPGETVYLKWRGRGTELTEVDEAEGKKFLRKAKQAAPIDAPLRNNEEIAALMNLSLLGFDLMRPATQKLNPDGKHAVVTIFRHKEKHKEDFGIWSERRYLGTLSAN